MSRRSDLIAGARDVAPMLLGVVPFGLLVGVTALEAGLSPAVTVGMSLFVFAGASQLAIIELAGEGAAPLVIAGTALVVNLRYLMYSASIAPRFREYAARWRGLFAYLLTDQAYALTVVREGDDVRWYYLGTAATIWLAYQAATVAGVVLGAGVPPGWPLSFAVPLTFLALLVPAIEDRPGLAAAVVGGGVAVAGRGLPYHLGLPAGAVAGVVAGLVSARTAGGGGDGDGPHGAGTDAEGPDPSPEAPGDDGREGE